MQRLTRRTRFRRTAAEPNGANGAAALPSLVEDDDWVLEIRESHPLLDRIRAALSPVAVYPMRTLRFLRTSPGLISLVGVVLVAAILAAGFAMSSTASSQERQLQVLSDSTEPLANASQNLYSSLSEADAISNTSFIRGSLETPIARQQYNTATANASLSILESAMGMGTGNEKAARLLAEIQTKLPVYSGMVESARAQSRAGNPVGNAYQASASELLRTEILPNAAELHSLTIDEVFEQQRQLATPPWVPLSGLLAAVFLLLLAQRWLAERTKRRYNVGLATATALMVIASLLVGIVSAVTWYDSNNSQQAATGRSAPLSQLTQMRITAQQARSMETLSVIERPADSVTTEFDAALDQVEIPLMQMRDSVKDPLAVDHALTFIGEWRRSHTLTQARLSNGDHKGAVAIILGYDPQQNSASAFNNLDKVLQTLIVSARANLREFMKNSLLFSQAIAQMVFVLSLLAVAAVGLGLRPRLQEYR